ncbi:MAG: O-antigen ligase family protein [Allosphingosinicella sp.]
MPLLIFSLGFMQPTTKVIGHLISATDIVFLPLAACWGLAILTGQIRLRWHPAWGLLLFYFAAQAVSIPGAEDPRAGLMKLVTQVYLLSLPVVLFTLIEDAADLKRAFRAWLAATAAIGIIAVASLALFVADPASPLLSHVNYRFGTLPPGDYPRLRLSFTNANMLCNYLSVSLMVLLASWRLRWVSRAAFACLLGAVAVSGAFTVSPGLGGIALVAGLWLWLVLRGERPALARLALAGGSTAAILFVLAMSVTPILHPTAPFLIRVPGLDLVLAPSGRLMIWIEAVKNFLADPLLGRGLDAESVRVRFIDPGGAPQLLTDAHNTYLNLAAQCGIAALAAAVLITWYVLRGTAAARRARGLEAAALALGLGFLGGFAYQGLGGSFEDSRHLWVAFGLFLAARRLSAPGSAGRAASCPPPSPTATSSPSTRSPPTTSA